MKKAKKLSKQLTEIKLLLTFAIRQLLSEWELEHLYQLADPDLPFEFDTTKGNLRGELEHLYKLGLISGQIGSTADLPDRGDDLKKYVNLTKLGKYYISFVNGASEKAEAEPKLSS